MWSQQQESIAHLVSEEAIVDKDAVQAVADHLVHKSGGHSAINAARQGADHVIIGPNLLIRTIAQPCQPEDEAFAPSHEKALADLPYSVRSRQSISCSELPLIFAEGHRDCWCCTHTARKKGL